MAYQATHWAWELELPTTQKFTLIALADMADEAFTCYPGQARLAKMIGSSVATVRRALASLEEQGLITRTQRRRDDGYRSSDRFQLHVGRSCRNLSGKNLTAQSVAPHRSSTPNLIAHGAGVITSRSTRESPDLFALDEIAAVGTFEEFYEAYPRHVGKGDAQRKFDAIVRAKKATAQQLVDAARRLAADPNLPEKKFVPHPATWLNQGRWDDEPLPARGGSERQAASLSLVEKFQREEGLRAEVSGGEAAGVRAIG